MHRGPPWPIADSRRVRGRRGLRDTESRLTGDIKRAQRVAQDRDRLMARRRIVRRARGFAASQCGTSGVTPFGQDDAIVSASLTKIPRSMVSTDASRSRSVARACSRYSSGFSNRLRASRNRSGHALMRRCASASADGSRASARTIQTRSDVAASRSRQSAAARIAPSGDTERPRGASRCVISLSRQAAAARRVSGVRTGGPDRKVCMSLLRVLACRRGYRFRHRIAIATIVVATITGKQGPT